MEHILKGAPVAKRINEDTLQKAAELKERGIVPALCIVRVGESRDDISYENSAIKRAEALGIEVRRETFAADIAEEDFFDALKHISADSGIHGILMFMPLPRHIDQKKARSLISPEKDVDGCTLLSLAGVFAGEETGFPPCTAEACLRVLDYYGIDPCGKSAAVIGRSLVIGRPLAMMLMAKNATVTICHTRTTNVQAVAAAADIVVACTGVTGGIGADYIAPGQVVIDVGIGWSEKKGKLCGDVDFDEAEPIAAAITPVPGGIGAVTTAVLMNHVVRAAGSMV